MLTLVACEYRLYQGVAQWMSLDELKVIKREITAIVGVARLESALSRTESVVSVYEEDQYCF